MVTIYPMLVSQAVSENIIPGIAKTLESYIIVYNMNDVITNPWGPRQINYKIKAGKIFAKENEDFSEAAGVPPGVEPGKGKKTKVDKPEEVVGKPPSRTQRPPSLKKAATAKARVTSSDFKSITLEPSYITVEVEGPAGPRTEFLGVKVVPLRVKSDAKLLDMLMYDYQMRAIQSMLVAQGRAVLRFAYKIINKWTGRLGKRPPTGDVRSDVILGKTGFTGNPFIVIDKGQDFDETFFSKPARISRLFKLGWSNIIIADSINRQAYFCLRQFKGTCNIISFAMLYQNLGQLKVYETLEDAKRQNSALFKVGPKIRRVLGECWSDLKRDNYILSEGKKDG